MKPELRPGIRAELSFVVTGDMCPHFDGVRVHPVCATWTLVQHMETAGRLVLAPHLESHEEGVGARIAVDHRSPAPIGTQVRVLAEATACSRRSLTCRVTAWAGPRLLAEAEFVQAVLEKRRLTDLFDSLTP
jgi:predicted thioesterase